MSARRLSPFFVRVGRSRGAAGGQAAALASLALRKRIIVKRPQGRRPRFSIRVQVLADEHALDVEHRAPAQLVGERRHAALDPAAHAFPAGLAFLGAEVVDDDHLAARAAHARQLAHDLLGIGHDRHHVHGDDGVEGGGGELQVARVHLVQAGDVGAGARWRRARAPSPASPGERSMPTISRCRP